MNNLLFWFKSRFVRFVIVGICITLISFFSIPPAFASRIDDMQLEAKVLRIIQEHPEAILESVQAYQQRQREEQQQQQQAFLQQMKANPRGAIGTSPTKGAAAQNIVLLVFSDFQCPYCAQAYKTLKQFAAKHQDRVTLTYKHLPLTNIHSQALPAAFSAWAAGQQGQFWAFHDALFEHQETLGEALYQSTAKSLKLDMEQFERDRNSNAASEAIRQDIEMAQALGANGTPFLVMNGEVILGAVEIPQLEDILAKVSPARE
ncbi:thioredoxin domain-containing protein [Lusitaniella coriacea LEGE 07157]|uniref:Thioredoxin domain-containing protein n=1 Tax=Lusitaniella coriacea LEGE 07157 TaxID=945747 RepID=A0A8J7J1M4_9CYAN|nr:DsbA family protein [Lusitaniella coriacea]MBE9115879.1 thioredoxin domain-containing protein [Lusitaniella coriacea LEGE 07157]